MQDAIHAYAHYFSTEPSLDDIEAILTRGGQATERSVISKGLDHLKSSKMILKSKISEFSKRMNQSFPKLLKKYPRLVRDVNDANDYRDKIAHLAHANSEFLVRHRLTDRIYLVDYKGGKKQILELTREEVQDRTHKNERIMGRLVGILAKVQHKRSTRS